MNTTGELKRLEPHDKNVQEIDWLYFPRPWKSSDWATLNPDHHRLWGLFQDDRLIGFALFHVPPHDDTAHLLKIVLIPKFRGTGLALQFWSDLSKTLSKEGLQKVYLEVEESNTGAQRFYTKAGFNILRRAKSYYSDGEAAIMMQLTL
ncbi:MAG: GNAT family N-acetyltransferase [Bacteriovoracaceae bacterium]